MHVHEQKILISRSSGIVYNLQLLQLFIDLFNLSYEKIPGFEYLITCTFPDNAWSQENVKISYWKMNDVTATNIYYFIKFQNLLQLLITSSKNMHSHILHVE